MICQHQVCNRPLSIEIHELENQEIPIDIPRDVTYTSVYSYVADTLGFHDNRLEHQPNAAKGRFNCILRISASTLMRNIVPRFFTRELRHGPFVYVLNVLHQRNILVDKHWNIKYIIDLEWACSRPIEMVHHPLWLTNQAIDEVDVDEYDQIRREFMSIFKEEMQYGSTDTIKLSVCYGSRLEHQDFFDIPKISRARQEVLPPFITTFDPYLLDQAKTRKEFSSNLKAMLEGGCRRFRSKKAGRQGCIR